MRCIIGLVLFVGLCYVGIQSLESYVTARALADDPSLSQRSAEAAAWKVVKEYHAYVYVAAGVLTLAVCGLTKLLERQGSFNEEGAWREEAERLVAQRYQKSCDGRGSA
jgi:hypothetical protein